jgi:hypothetical protein
VSETADSRSSVELRVKVQAPHDDLGDDDFHEWVQIGPNVQADRLGRLNSRMMTADWQPWVCNNPDCRGRALVHLDAIEALIRAALPSPATGRSGEQS